MIQNEFLSYIALVFLAFLFLFLVAYIVLKKKKEQGFFSRSMNLSLFLVTLPQRIGKEGEKEITLEEHLKTAEQFYSSLVGVKERNFIKRLLLGNPAFVFEIAVHRLGEEIYFYMACPRSIAGMIEKQILGFWPKAQVQPVPDYNIFNPTGFSAGDKVKLAKSDVLPIKNYKEFGADPLAAITSVFTKIAREEEGAAIQLVIRPNKSKIKRGGQKLVDSLQKGATINEALAETSAGIIKGLLKPSKQSPKPGEAPAPSYSPTVVQQEIIKSISEKIALPLFDVNLRILTSAPTKERAQQILKEVEAAFEQFNAPLLNQIKFKRLSKRLLKKLYYRFTFRIFNEDETMTLSSGELASIFHFPSPNLLTPHIKWLKTRQVAPPANLPEEGLVIGKNTFRGETRDAKMLDNDRRRHFYIIGQTGTGKSVFLQEMVGQDIRAGKGVCLICPHGDLAEAALGLVPSSRIKDVIYFDPGDTERPLGLNVLEYDPKFSESKTFVTNEILEIFEKLYNLKAHGMGGPMFEQYMRNASLLVMSDPESGSTLVEISRVLADANFRKYKLSRCKNMVVKNFWEMEAEKAGGEAALANMVPYITSKMNVFIANDLVRPIISQQKSSFNMREIMDDGKILIVNLAKGKIGDINSYLLGMVIVGKILIAAFSRADIPEKERRDFYLYLDEFQNVATQTISLALAEARKYRLSMIFAHQFIGQLDEEIQKAIFGNVGSMMAFRVGPEDAKHLLPVFEPVFDEEDLINLDNYNAAFKPLIKGETVRSFNIATYPPSEHNSEIARLAKEYSRVKYGRDKAIVEAELHKRLQRRF